MHRSSTTTPPLAIPGEAALRAQRQKWEKFLLELKREELRKKAAEATLEPSREAATLKELRAKAAEAERTATHYRDLLHEREEKIRRMQESFSWKATAPLRAFRRLAGFRGVAGKALDAATTQGRKDEKASDPRFLWSLDSPRSWNSAAPVGFIRGWFVWLPEARPANAIRARIGETIFAAHLGLPRPDVVSAHGFDRDRARDCGFVIDYRLPKGSSNRLLLEVEREDGSWLPFQDTTLTISEQAQNPDDYAAWHDAFCKLTPEREASLKQRLGALPQDKAPKFSIVMPVFNTPERWLLRAVDSVRGQLYPHWELCIADDASTAPHIAPLLERLAGEDARLRVVRRERNGHISAASNSALELATGDFVALLDHDDELAPDALAECALLLAAEPDTDLVYTDEDKIDEGGRLMEPYFKPDYLPELELGQHYLLHLAVYRTSLLRKIGGFREGYEGSQDWDLTLRVLEQSSPARIRHIPKVLYHWRAIAGSTALQIGEKNYAVVAARKALSDHFARKGVAAAVSPVEGWHWKITYPLPWPTPSVSIVVPTYNNVELLRTCVASVLGLTDYADFELLLVDNRTDDPEALRFLDSLREEPRVRVLRYDAPFNYSAINNFAAREARGEVLCLLNNDIEVLSSDWLTELVSHAARPEIGAVGAMLYYPNDVIQHAGILLGLGGVGHHAFAQQPRGVEGYMNRARLAQNYSAVTAACLAVRKEVYLQVGGLNEKDLSVAFNDVDFCLKVLQAGYRNLWTPFAELYHHESASRGFEDTPEKQARFQREVEYMRKTWSSLLDADPAYNPNLTLGIEGWKLSWPPRTGMAASPS